MIVKNIIREILKEIKDSKSQELVNKLLDKVSDSGSSDILTSDERVYLSQYSNNKIDKNLENWLLATTPDTFDADGATKLKYDEFDMSENIFKNSEKLIRIISNKLGFEPYTNDNEWDNAFVWNLKNKNLKTIGIFLHYNNDKSNPELSILKRSVNPDHIGKWQYEDYIEQVYEIIETPKRLSQVLDKYKK
jgi:hypothetical protein